MKKNSSSISQPISSRYANAIHSTGIIQKKKGRKTINLSMLKAQQPLRPMPKNKFLQRAHPNTAKERDELFCYRLFCSSYHWRGVGDVDLSADGRVLSTGHVPCSVWTSPYKFHHAGYSLSRSNYIYKRSTHSSPRFSIFRQDFVLKEGTFINWRWRFSSLLY